MVSYDIKAISKLDIRDVFIPIVEKVHNIIIIVSKLDIQNVFDDWLVCSRLVSF
jgi:hypothetical protein